METRALLSTTYLGPVQYYTKLIKYAKVIIEQHENFSKQSYRNRCVILGANGPLTLSVPVAKDHNKKIQINDLKISYETNWQMNHWRSIVSAYNHSPYFEFYEDDFAPFYHQKFEYLMDFNNQLQQTILDFLQLTIKPEFTSEFIELPNENTIDLRDGIHPKKSKQIEDNSFEAQNYVQVFSDKFEFNPNLSILDLLFNEGPNSTNILKQSIK